MVTLEDITESKKMERHLRNLAQIDSLTKLYNHRTIQRLEANSRPALWISLSVMMIDVDHFKVINDAYGHQRAIRLSAGWLARLRKYSAVDIIGRYGGDEFLLSCLKPSPECQNRCRAYQNIFTTRIYHPR